MLSRSREGWINSRRPIRKNHITGLAVSPPWRRRSVRVSLRLKRLCCASWASALIFPGDELLVKLAEPTTTADASLLPTAAESGPDEESDKVIPTRTIRPTTKPASTQTKEKLSQEVLASAPTVFFLPDNSPASGLPGNLSEDKDTDSSLLLVVAVFVVVGTALLLAGGFFRRQG